MGRNFLPLAPDIRVLQFDAERLGQGMDIFVGFEQDFTSLPV
jgi:hypothetical protein